MDGVKEYSISLAIRYASDVNAASKGRGSMP
jgi:hypothetical protein